MHPQLIFARGFNEGNYLTVLTKLNETMGDFESVSYKQESIAMTRPDVSMYQCEFYHEV
jgi:hypothetical protein